MKGLLRKSNQIKSMIDDLTERLCIEFGGNAYVYLST